MNTCDPSSALDIKEYMKDITTEHLKEIVTLANRELYRRKNPTVILDRWKRSSTSRSIEYSWKNVNCGTWIMIMKDGDKKEKFSVKGVNRSDFESAKIEMASEACKSSNMIALFDPYNRRAHSLDIPLCQWHEPDMNFDYDHETGSGYPIPLPTRNEDESFLLLENLDLELNLGSLGVQRFIPFTEEGKELLKMGWKPLEYMSWFDIPDGEVKDHSGDVLIDARIDELRMIYHCPCDNCIILHPFSEDEMTEDQKTKYEKYKSSK